MNSQSIASYPEVSSLPPDKLTLAKAYYSRGLAYDAKGDYDRAIADFTKAVKLKPNDANVLLQSGYCLLR